MNSHLILAIDRASVRTVDKNGYLHVASSHITKATVNPYYGREVPYFEKLGLDPDKIYYGLRDPQELQKSLKTWEGIPLHIEHHVDSAKDPQKSTRVGSVGTEITWNDPYIDAPLIVWDQEAIDAINDGSFRELSCCYWYDPDFTPGQYDGKPYDFVMRNIKGNHVALVEEGRAGKDVLVADSALKKGFAMDNENKGLADAIIGLHKTDPKTGELLDVVGDESSEAELKFLLKQLEQKLSPEEISRLMSAVSALSSGAKNLETQDEGEKDMEDIEKKDELNPEENVKDEDLENKIGEQDDEGEAGGLDENNDKAEDEDDEEKAEDDQDSLIERVLAKVPGLTDEQKEALRAALASPVEDEEPEAEPELENKNDESKIDGATDNAMKKNAKKFLGAEDAAKIRAEATAQAMKTMREISDACRKVRPLVGEMDALAFDSANTVYKTTLKQLGVDPKKYPASAWRGMVDMMLREHAAQTIRTPGVASDSKPIPDKGPFANLNRINLSM